MTGNHQTSAYAWFDRLIDLGLHTVTLEDGPVASIKFHPFHHARLNAIYEFNDGLVFLFGVDADGGASRPTTDREGFVAPDRDPCEQALPAWTFRRPREYPARYVRGNEHLHANRFADSNARRATMKPPDGISSLPRMRVIACAGAGVRCLIQSPGDTDVLNSRHVD